MEEYIAADPQAFDQHELLEKLQNLSLEWREQDPFVSLVISTCQISFFDHIYQGWLTPGQLFVIEEYCSRYNQKRDNFRLYIINNLSKNK